MMPKIQSLFKKFFIPSLFILASTPAKAQITPDSTLGAEASSITPNALINGANADLINGGAQRSGNLFHSFTQFNINDGQRVYFGNPSGVQNILTRVTGGNGSNILGTLGVNGNANLFLINPNGIVFGQNASLDIRGSFVGTTANGVQFGNQGVFSATNPEAPPLLTVNPSALLFNQINQNAIITNQSQAPAGVNLAGQEVTGLQVPDGKSLLLVGGNVNLDGGRLTDGGGRVELASLVEAGSIGIQGNGNNLSLSFPNGVGRGDISLTNGAYVDVAAGGGGSVAVNARNLNISGGSTIGAGIVLGEVNSKAGNIEINATDTITIDGTSSTKASSAIVNGLLQGSGSSGDITINTGSLNVIGNAQIGSATNGQGDAGNVTIRAKDKVSFSGTNSGVVSLVGFSGVGNGANVNIQARELYLANGTLIATSTLGKGSSGNIQIKVEDSVFVSEGSNISSATVGQGNAGSITVEGGRISLTNNAQMNASTYAKGNAGNIFITARDAISLDGAYIINNVQSSNAVGNAGKIDINTGSLTAINGAQINSFTRGIGNAGNITIQARDTVTFDGADSDGNQSGLFSVVGDDAIGNGGTVNITSGSLSLNNGGRLGLYVSNASDVLQGKKAIGDTANINVRDAFTISGEGSGIFASIGSGVVGRGGDVNIQAGNLFIQNAGEISSFLASGAEGRGGDVSIQAGNLFIKDGGEINSSTYGKGNSGNISIAARDAISLDSGSSIYNNVQSSDAIGNAGNIDITTVFLKIENNAGIFAGTFGKGNGGNITVEAKDLVEILSDGDLDSGVAQSARGNAGDITIKTGRLIVINSQIGPSVFGEGNAGNFKIIATDSVELSGQISKREDDTSPEGSVGFPGGLFAQIDLLGKGRAGNLTIETKRLSVSDGSKIQAATFGDGDAGNIFIRADEIDLFETEKPNFYNTGIFAGVQTDGRIDYGIIDLRNGRPPVGRGGNLTIETRTLSLRNGAEVFVETTGEGDAGKLFIRASESINVTGISTGTLERQRTSRITAGASQRSTGNGGSLTIETPLLNVTDGGIISSNSEGKGIAGDINITSDIVRLNNGKIIAQTASTDGGNINFNLSQYLFLRNGSQISTTAGTAQAGGNGGNITINTPFIVAAPKENSDITANAFSGAGGNINISTQSIFGIEARPKPSEQTNDITASSELGVQGQIDIRQPEVQPTQGLIELPNEVIDASTKFSQLCPRDPNPKPLGNFIVTGRGSLPPSPLGFMTGTSIQIPLATLDEQTATPIHGAIAPVSNASPEIIEAQGWIKTADGIVLVANAPQVTPSSRPTAAVCPMSR